MINNLRYDNFDALTVIMATPELADYCAQSAQALGFSLLQTLATCAKATIPGGHRVGFMSSALSYLWEKRSTIPLSVPNPDKLVFFETDTGEVFWRDIT